MLGPQCNHDLGVLLRMCEIIRDSAEAPCALSASAEQIANVEGSKAPETMVGDAKRDAENLVDNAGREAENLGW